METPPNTHGIHYSLFIIHSTLFPSVHGMLIMIIHSLGRKTTLNQFQKIEILRSVSYGHNGIAFEINKNKSSRKAPNIFMLNDEL